MADNVSGIDLGFWNNYLSNTPGLAQLNINPLDLMSAYNSNKFTGIENGKFIGGDWSGKDVTGFSGLNDPSSSNYNLAATNFMNAQTAKLNEKPTNFLDIEGMSNMDLLKGGLGIGQLGLGVLSYLNQSDLADSQKKLMGQQYDQNKFLIDQAKQRQKDISSAFGGNNGLAASSTRVR